MPSVFTPQAWYSPPTLTAENAPEGGVASPNELSPQQAMAPPLVTPHVKIEPVLTEENVPAGGIISPDSL